MTGLQELLIPLSLYTAITWSWPGDLKFHRAPWDRQKMKKIIAFNFTFSHHVLMAIVAFLWSPRGVLSHSHGVLVGVRLHAHGTLTERSRRARSGHCAHMASTLRWWRARNVRTASARSGSCIKSSAHLLCLNYTFTSQQ